MSGRRGRRMDAAWDVVGVGFAVCLFSSGIRFSVGPFVASLLADFGFSHTYLSAVVAAAMLVYGVGMVIGGWLADLWGTRAVLAGGSLMLSASLALAAWTRSSLLFSVAFALLGSLGFAAAGQTVLSPLISRWFRARRGFAMTFLSSGAMGGIAIMTPLSAALIAWVGWRATYLLYALLFLVVVTPLALWVLRDEATVRLAKAVPASPPEAWRRALRTRPFWFLLIGFFGCGLSMNLLGTHGVPMLEHHGFSTMTASFGIGLIGLVSVFGSLAVGGAADRIGGPRLLALIYLVRGLGFVALALLGREWELYAVGAVGGMVWAGSSALTSVITADLYGVSSVGTLFGFTYLGHQAGGAIGAYLGGWSYAALGSYTLAFLLAAGILFLGAFLATRLSDAPTRLAHAERRAGLTAD